MGFIPIRGNTKLVTTGTCNICHGTGKAAVGSSPCVACDGTGHASISIKELVDYIDAELGERDRSRSRM